MSHTRRENGAKARHDHHHAVGKNGQKGTHHEGFQVNPIIAQ